MPRYIDAEGLNLYDNLFMSEDTINKSGVYVRYRAVENLIKNAPTEDVAPVAHGKWERKDENSNEIFCSHCDYKTIFLLNSYWNYCPNCGAKMDGRE